jgi:hypothetical protein
MAGRTTTVTVDSIEAGVAVLVDDERSASVPVAWLPDGAKEGDVLRLSLEPDPEAAAELAGRVSRGLGRLRRRGD